MTRVRFFAAIIALAVGAGNARADEKAEDPAVAVLKARVAAYEKELKELRKRNEELEDLRVKLATAAEEAKRARAQTENERKLALAQLEELLAQIKDLKGRGPEAPPLPWKGVMRPVLPDNVRGAVSTDPAGDTVRINLGADVGLEPGMVLDVYRETGGGKYLGTVTVTKVSTKEATGTFRPARPVTFEKLRPDELPRKGDTVGSVTLKLR